MSLERIVQIHIATLATIGAVLLGMGQDSPLLPVLAIFAAVTSIIFTDMLRWFCLNRWVANAAALAALFFSLTDFFRTDTRGQLMAIANLLICLQIVLFYQRKSDRLYWQLAVLSLLQIVVSAALNVGIEFGVGLILYAAVAFSTLSFFFVHREVTRCARTPDKDSARQRTPAKKDQPPSRQWEGMLQRTPIAWPLETAYAVGRQVVDRGLVRQTAAIGLMTLAFAFVLFFSAPRLDSSGRRRLSSQVTRVVGFSTEVTLDEMGEVLESSKPIMRVRFRDPESETPHRVYGEPYFRGVVLTDYVSQDGGVARWRRLTLPWSLRGVISERGRQLPAPPANKTLVRQDILLEPISEAVLFGIPSSYRSDASTAEIYRAPVTGQLSTRSQFDARSRGQIRYSIETTGILGGLQIDVTPHRIRSSTPENLTLLAWEQHRLLSYDETQFPVLKRIADEIGDEQRRNNAKRATLARALRNHFLTSDRYTYSLDFRKQNRNPSIDPIEDFVANHGTGHCEYFASALVIMLRSQGIPARLVTGFRGGEYNVLGGYYQFLESDAHAWVEAYMEPEDALDGSPPNSDLSPVGGWLRLDPTPGSDVDKARQLETGPMDVVDDVLDYARILWSDYILGLTAKRQRERIFNPVSEKTKLEDWSALFTRWRDNFRLTVSRFQRVFTTWQGWVAILGLSALAAFFFLFRHHWRRFQNSPVAYVARRWRSRVTRRLVAGTQTPQSIPVEFYRRLEELLRQLGMTRRPSVTPREFASRAADQLKGRAFPSEIRGVPARIVEALYSVRFGRMDLQREDVQAIDNGLGDLERAIAIQTTEDGRSEQAAS